MPPVGMACRPPNVRPKMISHSAGWMARVTSSERSWRSFCISTMQNVTMRVANQRTKTTGPERSRDASTESTGSATGAADTAELTSLFVERVAGVIAEHLVERRGGAEGSLQLGRRAD